ncbi:cytochrome P450 4V2-like [Tetranychus urticae]|uniref:Cytochrome P450 n=1 Tax=Tetranychus urticae TaxID=32264 RepID=T1JTD6_TETUR|nr:cytochrome P450 4V2-like [Tetranychus urticae]
MSYIETSGNLTKKIMDQNFASTLTINRASLNQIGSTNLVYWLLFSTILLIVANLIQRLISFVQFQSQLSKLPQEPSNPLTGHINRFGITLTTLTNLPEKAIMDECERLFDKYRKTGFILIKLMWKPFLIICNHSIVKMIAAKNGLVERGGQIYLLKPWIGDSVTTSSGSAWYSKRRTINLAFNMDCLPVYTKIIERQTVAFISKLNSNENIGQQINLSHWIHLLGLGFIVEIISGQFIDFLNQQGAQYFDDLEIIQQSREQRLWFPLYWSEFIYSLTPSGWKHRAALSRVHQFSQSLVESALKSMRLGEVNRVKGKPIVDLIVQSYWEEAKRSGSTTVNVQQIRQELDGLIMGTFDTTPNAITFTLYLLGLHQSYQEQLYQQLNELDRDHETGLPRSQDIMKLAYLDGVVKEALRLYPPVPFVQRQLDSEITIDGQLIPPGMDITLCLYFLHRDPEIFPEPESFFPDRWSNSSTSLPLTSYLPFGFGLRHCVGKKLGLIIMKLTIAHIIINFKLTSDKPLKSSDVKLSTAIIPKIPLMVSLERRIIENM